MSGASIGHRRLGDWHGRSVQNTFGAQLRNDDITTIGLSHTEARQLLETVRQDSVLPDERRRPYAQSETQWNGWLRTLAGIRAY